MSYKDMPTQSEFSESFQPNNNDFEESKPKSSTGFWLFCLLGIGVIIFGIVSHRFLYSTNDGGISLSQSIELVGLTLFLIAPMLPPFRYLSIKSKPELFNTKHLNEFGIEILRTLWAMGRLFWIICILNFIISVILFVTAKASKDYVLTSNVTLFALVIAYGCMWGFKVYLFLQRKR